MILHPADAGTGIQFKRTDITGGVLIPAKWDHVVDTRLCTTIGNSDGVTIGTVEHLMAALAGCGIDNALIELDGPEVPIMDGSAQPFVSLVERAGVVEQDAPRRPFVVRHTVCVKHGDAMLLASPGPLGRLMVNYDLDYGLNSPIGRHRRVVDVTPDSFREELAASRTFLLAEEAEQLRSQGIGSRVGYGDLLIFGPEGVIDNTLRFEDECVRHKILDLIGDLTLLGSPLEGHLVAIKSGHRLNAELVRGLIKAHQPFVEVSSATKYVAERDKAAYHAA